MIRFAVDGPKKSNKKSLACGFFFTRYDVKSETKRTRFCLANPPTAFCFIRFVASTGPEVKTDGVLYRQRRHGSLNFCYTGVDSVTYFLVIPIIHL